MIEQYLKDSIPEPDRKEKAEKIAALNLIPPRIYKEIRRQDSMMHLKDSSYLIAKGYIKIIKDTIGLDDDDEEDALDKIKKDRESVKAGDKQKKDSTNHLIKNKAQAILPDEKKKPEAKDSITKN
ncbi:MAG: hypothetical protein HY305_02050 [Sphingobacteriales bacterium]|nr:hypothetical protein [Sphingobacteriales bacterium]